MDIEVFQKFNFNGRTNVYGGLVFSISLKGTHWVFDFFVRELQEGRRPAIRITMEPATNHVNPHIHLNKQHVEHFASIGLNGEFIYGQERLNRKEKAMILEWVNSHSITLRELWDCAKAGRPDYQRLVNKVNNSWEFPVFRNGIPIAENRKDGSCRQYVLFFLGRNEDAMNWMNRVIDFQPNDSGNYYDKACLCSRMGLLNEAIEAVDLMFQKGYRKFAHLDADDDIDPIRNMPEYIESYNKYHAIYMDELEQIKDIL